MTDPKKPEDETTKLDTAKAVDPNVDTSKETTPVFDEVKNGAGEETPEEAPSTDAAAVETADSVKVDIKRALDRETQDGKGDEDPGPSDFQGFATEGVEKEDGQ